MIKKTIIIATIFFSISVYMKAQNDLGKTDDLGRVALFPYVSDEVEGLPASAKGMLENKLRQLATNSGLAGGTVQRFILTANITILNKEITSSAPIMHVYNLDVTFYIADIIGKAVFSSTSKNIKGVGQNETKAYIQALQNINTKDPELKRFIDTGKEKIIEFYNSGCDLVLKEARAMANMKKYEEAIFNLMSIPEVCKECYMQAMNMVGPIYKEYADVLCEQLLIKAKAEWAGQQNVNGATIASEYLGRIDPDARCIGDAEAFITEMKSKIKADEDKAWDFTLKQWDDGVDLEKQRIGAYKEVGLAYANSGQYPYFHDGYSLGWLFGK